MYFDPASGLFLPRGVRLASRGQVVGAWFLGLALFIVTLGIGYITWSLFTWGQGRSPAQRMLGLRCWLPEPRRVAGREQTAPRQITGFCLNGQLLSGFFISTEPTPGCGNTSPAASLTTRLPRRLPRPRG
jgi:hypothetical protein